MDDATIAALKGEYLAQLSSLQSFGEELVRQLTKLLEPLKKDLAVPIALRVKAWESIEEKIERKLHTVSGLQDITDLVGIRIIMLFQPDIPKVCSIIEKNFEVLEREDTKLRLEDEQFGYSSVHYLVGFKKKLLRERIFAPYIGLRAEIQVRTTAEHTWAAASHVLQYKPEPGTGKRRAIVRSISRVSALLETVDLELERVIALRASYQKSINVESESEELNVDLVAKVLDELLPAKNKTLPETYADLLRDLNFFKIRTPKDLRDLLLEQRDTILNDEAASLALMRDDPSITPDQQEKLDRGVYFTHVGLTLAAMRHRYGKKWEGYIKKNKRLSVPSASTE